MGKPKIPSLFAGTPKQPEPVDSWMSDLQLQTVTLDPVQWSRPPNRPSIWRTPKPRARLRRLH